MLKDIRIIIGDETMIPSSNVRNIGVVFNSFLNMANHLSAICRTAYLHLHNISHIRRYITTDATKSLDALANPL